MGVRQMLDPTRAALRDALRADGLTPDTFAERFGRRLTDLTPAVALALLHHGEKSREPDYARAAVSTLGGWLVSGHLDALPDPVPGFADNLARYRDRATLLAFTRHILACAPWSLTGEERAAQFVAVLAPFIERTKLRNFWCGIEGVMDLGTR